MSTGLTNRRWFQFRLRAVLAFVTVFCIACALIARRSYQSIDPGDFERYPPRQPAPDGVEFQAAVDGHSYQIGDPIRLEIELRNSSRSTYMLVMPRPWHSQMAFGVRLTCGKRVIINHEPSAIYVGSYWGPPRFQSFAPGDVFRHSLCLQHFSLGTMALPEGEYQLELAFDSSRFDGINPQGQETVCRFDAKPVALTIKGPPRTDPEEILRVVGDKTGMSSIVEDITGPDTDRKRRAWGAVFDYGDSRLSPFLRKYVPENDLTPGDLEIMHPFAATARR